MGQGLIINCPFKSQGKKERYDWLLEVTKLDDQL